MKTWTWWPACANLDCSRGPCMWVDNCGVGYCAKCADDDPWITIQAASLHSFDPVWLLATFISDKNIDDRLSSNKRLADLFYCDERFRKYPDRVLIGPLKISELHPNKKGSGEG